MDIKEFLHKVIESQASDLHLSVGARPILRMDGGLKPIDGVEFLSPADVEDLVYSILTPEQKEMLLMNKEIDFSFAYGDLARFRVNAFHQRGYLAAAFRLIPYKIPTLEELNLPTSLYDFCYLPQGFILITGPAGHGKSTTIASLLNYINETRNVHIITVEDPIEYIYPQRRSLVDQRELHLDTHSWEIALRSILREDPDVVLIGEMRDYETISSAITIAETGHLVFASLHTNSSPQTIDRIIDVFPENQQRQVRVQLAAILEGITSQRLVPAIGGGRVPAVEIMKVTPAVRTMIREGKTHQLPNIIATSIELGMVSLDRALAEAVKGGLIEEAAARSQTLHPEEFQRILRSL